MSSMTKYNVISSNIKYTRVRIPQFYTPFDLVRQYLHNNFRPTCLPILVAKT